MQHLKKTLTFNSVAVIGNYLPRICGIATFTTDLCDALSNEMAESVVVSAVAMDDINEGYNYPERVKFQLRDNVQAEYMRAADFLNVDQYDVAILQHEYGIFGGPNGSNILMLIKNLNMPVITTLHTILENPTEGQKSVMLDIVKYSDAVVSQSQKGVSLLQDIYKVPKEKIKVIHHGIHDIGFEDPWLHKETFGVEDRKLILSFGLIHPGKGLEYAIKALPAVIEKHPEVMYIILGATHPNILRESGDAYRNSLHLLVNKLGLEQHVQFKNKFVSLPELCQYIGASDIYLTPYPKPEQIVSGTLAYAVGAGKAIISTPYWYAEELLADERGVLVDFESSEAIAEALIGLLENENQRNSMRRKAYQFGRAMTWKEVAREYISLAQQVTDAETPKPKSTYLKAPVSGSIDGLAVPKLDHFRVLTDGVGMLQHANYSVPDRNHGYCIDDNARALIVACRFFTTYKDESVIPLVQTYLAFLFHGFNEYTGRFRNFMSYDRKWLEETGSEDAHGRAIWALGTCVKKAHNDSVRHMANRLFTKALPAVEDFQPMRSIAFSLLGIHSYLEIYSGDAAVRKLRKTLSTKLFNAFPKPISEEWPWFEDKATYANAIIPHALMLAGQWIPDPVYFETGVRILKWLLKVQTAQEGHLSVIGNSTWMTQDGVRAGFDQQPIEAMCTVEACAQAYRATGDKEWLHQAQKGVNWFLGLNDLNLPLYDFKTGGCFDGLENNGVNQNQGAESTLACLISLLTIQEITAKEVVLERQ